MECEEDGRPALDQPGPLQAPRDGHDLAEVQPGLLRHLAQAAGAVEQRMDLDHGGGQAGPIGVSAAGRLASEDELFPIIGYRAPGRNTASPRRPGPER